MPDYTHLLATRLTPGQRHALDLVIGVARAQAMTVYLTGGAVRDIISGSSVRDLDISVQGNALKLRKDLEKAGLTLTGEHEPSRTLFFLWNRHTRLEVSSTRTEYFPKPAKPEYKPAGILDDLRRRDFTANAMALSLNAGSYGLLLDPLNGTADIQAQHLRLANNYGFLDDPIRLVRATRLLTRTGWSLEERTKTRYANAKDEGVIESITAYQRGYELEEIAYEEDALAVLRALESEGWMKHLFPAWTHHSVDTPGLHRLHERHVQLLMAGLHPDAAAAAFTQLTAKMSSANLGALKRLFPRKGLVQDAAALEHGAKEFSKQLFAKENAKPAQTWRLFHSANAEAVLWLFFTGKGAALQHRYNNFFTKWNEARQKLPYAILQEMRIKPELTGYAEILDKMTFAFMDGELTSEETIRKFLEPFSPPAPPPPVSLRKPRAVKRIVAPKSKRKAAKAVQVDLAHDPATLAAIAASETAPAAVAQAGGKPVGKPAAKPEKTVKPAVAQKAAVKTPAKTAPVKTVAAKPGTQPVAKPAAKAASKGTAKKPAAAVQTAKSAKPAPAKKAATKTATPAVKKAEKKKPAAKPQIKTPAKPQKKAAKPTAKPAKAAAKSAKGKDKKQAGKKK